MAEQEKDVVRAGMSEDDMRENLIRLVFQGERGRYEDFCGVLRRTIPEGTSVVLRGSSVTGMRYDGSATFDGDGHGTSDLDLTLVGGEVLGWYEPSGFYIPGVHSKPLSDAHPDVAPSLVPLRQQLMRMVNRPVNIQATRGFIMPLREHLMRQPYLTLIGKVEGT